MTFRTVLLDIADDVATVTLNRADSLNPMTSELMQDLSEAIATAEASDQAPVLVITGAGRGFCSGADLRTDVRPLALVDVATSLGLLASDGLPS